MPCLRRSVKYVSEATHSTQDDNWADPQSDTPHLFHHIWATEKRADTHYNRLQASSTKRTDTQAICKAEQPHCTIQDGLGQLANWANLV